MLSVIFGNCDESIYAPAAFFDVNFEPSWLDNELARSIIQDVDKSEVKSGYCIESPILGQIPPQMLAGGTKALLLMINYPDKIFNASACGDNCAHWILEIGKRQDITINLRHIMHFDEEFEIYLPENNKIVTDMEDLLFIGWEKLEEDGV